MENKNSNVTISPPSEAKWGRCPKGGEGLQVSLSRGLRNNNPLNIRHSRSKWKGMSKTQTDHAFVQFESMAYGYRAAFVLLRTYRKKYGCNTLRKIISRWAPPNENNTERYIKNVSMWSGINPDKLIAGQDAEAYINIVAAMSRQESPIPAFPDRSAGGRASEPAITEEWLMSQIQEGWRLI